MVTSIRLIRFPWTCRECSRLVRPTVHCWSTTRVLMVPLRHVIEPVSAVPAAPVRLTSHTYKVSAESEARTSAATSPTVVLDDNLHLQTTGRSGKARRRHNVPWRVGAARRVGLDLLAHNLYWAVAITDIPVRPEIQCIARLKLSLASCPTARAPRSIPRPSSP